MFSLLETRVLGVLAEKQRTVPDSYPLTLNSLVAGCNQKTSRNPVMDVTDAEVQMAIDSLKAQMLVIEASGGRVPRYAHNIERVLQIPTQATALLSTLMLRGSQTAGELRINCERLHKFADISATEAFLDELAERPAGALTVKLNCQAGSREPRWMHLLSGMPAVDEGSATTSPLINTGDVTLGELAALKANLTSLTAEVSDLRAQLNRLYAELGIVS